MFTFGWRSRQILHWPDLDNLLHYLQFLRPALRAIPVGAY